MKARSTQYSEAASDSSSTEGRVPAAVRRAAAAMAVTVGATAVMTAVAAPASAETERGKVWNRVAQCESGQRWDINTGNGFYGGLQFSDRTWDSFGGNKYASRADKANREQQIEVARRVLDRQGPGAWPVCSKKAGLTRGSGDATSSRLPDRAASTSTPSSSSKKSTVAKASKPRAAKPGKPHTAKHRSAAAAAAKPSAHKAKHAGHRTYTVRSGDTLAKIARKAHVAGGWKALYRANKSTVRSPDTIHVGQVLRLPV